MTDVEYWVDEPDTEDGEHAGYPYALRRHSTFGCWLGYVTVPYGHPWYGKDYDDPVLEHVAVHGGLTFADYKDDGLGWTVGFDCGHGFDLMPGLMDNEVMKRTQRMTRGTPFPITYKDIEFARRQARRLCKQAADAAANAKPETKDKKR